MGLALVLVGVLAPTVLAKPIFNFGKIFNGIKKMLNQLADAGLMDLADSIQQETKDLLDGVFPGSPGQPFPVKLLPFLLYTAEFASASYCDGTFVVNKRTQCKDPFCPTVTKNNVLTSVIFANQGSADTTGIVVRDVTTKTIVVAYRGSQSIRNWFTNALIEMKSIPQWCPGCEVHSGFLNAFQEEQATVVNSVTKLLQKYPEYRLVVTGHSLGGGIATIAATELRKRGFQVSLVTYGSPRVGNEALAKYISASGSNFRVTHLNDPVPRLPPLTVGYRHVEPEYHIFRGDSPIGPSDIKVYRGTVNFQGNTGFGGVISFNTTAHRHYFLPTKMSGCDDSTREGIEFKI
ncbi:Alpha/Beta hydrolase protein [Tirmania nivea]|nr:Alpha/Beta hydrolase protein [Tirmania nivea]